MREPPFSHKFDAPMRDRIDYIFVRKQATVLDYAVLTDSQNQHYPSDHQPVASRVVLP